MKIGIVGLPNVGKSTLFKALTKIQVDINNYPFCTIDPNIGTVEVPDKRVEQLSALFHSAKKVYATIEFVDIAGLVKGAADGQGLGNQFLHNIREVDAIIQVVRLFKNKNISHAYEDINPKRDIEVINTELILKDLETVEKRLAKLNKEARSNEQAILEQKTLIEEVKAVLDKNDLIVMAQFIKNMGDDFETIKDLQLLSSKPILYLFNTSRPENIEKDLENFGLKIKSYVALDIKIEEELLELSDKEQQELEIKSNLKELIKKSYQLLNLITFLTTGPDETRAWTIPAGSTAPQAGSAIHGDFEKKFICAEIISYEDLVKAGSKQKARDLGLIRTEGKEYLVQDGDVIEFKI